MELSHHPAPTPAPPLPTPEPKPSGEDEEEDEVAKARMALGCPILYVTIDPDMQWIAEVRSQIHEIFRQEVIHMCSSVGKARAIGLPSAGWPKDSPIGVYDEGAVYE